MKKFLATVTAVVLSFAMVALPSISATAEGNQPPHAGDKVTICHSPSSATNLWVVETVSVNSMKSPAGHIDPSGSDTHADDIIPSFTYDEKDPNDPNAWVSVTYPGKNLSTTFGGYTGAQILANGCVIPTPVVVVTTPTPSPTPTDPSGDITFEVEATGNPEVCVPGEGDEAGETTPGSITLTFDPNDNGVDKIEYSVKGSGVWFDAASNVINGLEDGTYTIRITVVGGYDLVGDEEFDVTVGADNDPACKKVTICHWDQSDKWTSLTVSKASLQSSGHIDPSTEDTHAFDIVPPFDSYLGKNYNATSDNVPEYKDLFPFNGQTGQAILEAGCNDPVVEDDEVAVTATPTGETCDSESGQVSPGSILVTITPNGGATVEYRKVGDLVWIPLTTNPITGLAGGTYEFQVAAASGYVLTTPSSFNKVVATDNSVGCDTRGPVLVDVDFTPATCNVDGSYTLTSPAPLEGVPAKTVTWYVNDVETEPGTYPAEIGDVVTVKVVAIFPLDYPVEIDGVGVFPEYTYPAYEFTAPTACDLTTLALTGSSDTTPTLALTAFLGLLGLAMVRSGIRVNRIRQEA